MEIHARQEDREFVNPPIRLGAAPNFYFALDSTGFIWCSQGGGDGLEVFDTMQSYCLTLTLDTIKTHCPWVDTEAMRTLALCIQNGEETGDTVEDCLTELSSLPHSYQTLYPVGSVAPLDLPGITRPADYADLRHRLWEALAAIEQRVIAIDSGWGDRPDASRMAATERELRRVLAKAGFVATSPRATTPFSTFRYDIVKEHLDQCTKDIVEAEGRELFRKMHKAIDPNHGEM